MFKMYGLNIIMGFLNYLLNKNLIVTIGITLLLSAVVVYYCNSRFVTLERGLQRQNQVLAEFIANVQGELRNSVATVKPHSLSHNLATQEAITSAEKHYINGGIRGSIENKIEVSDDDDDDDDNTSSSSSTENSDVENSDVENSEDEVEVEVEVEEEDNSSAQQMTSIMNLIPSNNEMDIKVISMSMSGESNIELSDITQLLGESFNNSDVKPMITELNDLEVMSSDSDDSDIDDDTENDNKLSLVKVEKKDAFEMLTSLPAPTVNNMDYKKMNVSALRELLIERGLSSGSDSRKMKKTDLIDALSK